MALIGLCVFENAEWCTVPVYAEQYIVTVETYVLVSSISCGPNKMEKLLTQRGFPCKSSGHFFQADSRLVLGHYLVRPLAYLQVTEYIFSGLRHKRGMRNTSCQYWWLKTANSRVYQRGP